jgi:hypothetical protein
MRLIALFAIAALTLAAANAASNPIKELAGITPNEAAFTASSATKPIVLKSAEEAAPYFTAENLGKLGKEVDFTAQFVLLFAWQGSGQDKIDYTVAESWPEQIRFGYTPGRTFDLRPHTRIFVLRSNVVWSAR